MKQIARLDYLDLQIYADQKTTVNVPQKDTDGVSYSSTLMVSDALSYEIFELLKISCHSSAWNSRVLYQGESKDVFISSRPFQKSLQFKGLFFLRPDAIAKLQMVVQFLKERQIKFLVSRIDISFIVQEPKIYKSLDQCDFKRLTQYLLKKKKETVYYKAYNSRFALVAYGKTAQVKKEKGSDYLKTFLTYYGLTDLPADLVNLELRVLGTDSCGDITEQIVDSIDLVKLKSLVIEQATKRIQLTKKIYNLLLKSSI